MMDNLFTAISSEKMASLITEASKKVILATPAVFEVTVRALLAAHHQLGSDSIEEGHDR